MDEIVKMINDIRNFTVLGGGALVLGEVASLLISKYKNDLSGFSSNKKANYKAAKNIQGTGLVVSKNIMIDEKYNYEGFAIFGPTGTGKTTKFAFKNLLRDDIKGSIIVTDPVGELFTGTSKYQKDVCGRKVFRINLEDVTHSDKYNLLENCKTTQEVLYLASSLLLNGSLSIELMSSKKTGGVEWVQMAEPLLAAALLYARTLDYPYNNVEFAFLLLVTLNTEQLELLFQQSKNIDVMTQFNMFKLVGGADRTEGSIKITLASNMKAYIDKSINTINSRTTFDISSFRTTSSILYVSYPERKATYYSPYIAPFFNSIIDKLLDSYKPNSLPISMMFDEFGNIGALNNVNGILSTCRKREISVSMCLHSISQLYQIYGTNNTKSMLNNIKTKVILPGLNDIETINYISNLCGTVEINTSSETISKNSSSKSNSKTKRNMFEDGEIRTLKDNEGLILIGNLQPIVDKFTGYFEDTIYKDRVGIKGVDIAEDKLNISDLNAELRKIKLELVAQLEKDNDSESILGRIFTK